MAQEGTRPKPGKDLRESVFSIAEAAACAENLQDLFARIHAIIDGLMPARNFYAALLGKKPRTRYFPYWADEKDKPPSKEAIPFGHGLTEYILSTGKPLYGRPEILDELVTRGEIRRGGSPAIDYLGVPLTAGGRTIGMMAVQTYTENTRYTTRDLAILEFVANQVSLFVHRRRAEEELEEAHRKLDTLVGNLPGIAYRCANDPRWTMEYISQGCRALTGYPPEDLIGNSRIAFGDLIHPEYRESLWQRWQEALRRKESFQGEYPIRAADGTEKWVQEQGCGVFAADGSLLALEGLIVDITDRVRAENERQSMAGQLAQAQKMESVGRLAGGVAHDFNNLLTGILGNASLALSETEAPQALREYLGEIVRAAESGAKLTRQLLAFSRKQTVEPRVVDLGEILAGMRNMLGRILGEDVTLRTEAPADLWRVLIDPGQVEQVVVNLAVNARDAMPEGGTLAITAANVKFPAAVPDAAPAAVPDAAHAAVPDAAGAPRGEYVCLSVRDCGSGMSAEVKRHLFEPFFTTKAQGKGTGLGLAMVYGAVQQNGGFIDVDSEEGRGTEFRLHFPRSAAGARTGRTPAVQRAAVGGRETLLLAEDEAIVRDLARRILSGLGYTVVACASGEEALERSRQGSVRFSLLVTDIVMPGMGGRELADRIWKEHPGMPVLFTSGYTDDRISRDGILEQGFHFLGKPYTPRELARKVRDVLDG